MVGVPPSLLSIAGRVERRLAEVVELERQRWSELDPELAAPIDALADLLLSGGKRLRPAFCYWGFVGAGGGCGAADAAAIDADAAAIDADAAAIDAGAAFELLHAFALVHDDVMDGSSTRRGARTTHLVFADRHEYSGWIGEARRFGEGVAILVGDLAFVYADQLLHGAPLPALEVWNELRVELNIGQYLDILGTARSERTPHRTRRIARYKSGKYTVERPLHLGALLAAPERAGELVAALSRYGLPLGDAFQMRDDVLGAFGEENLTGKPVGDDLREGKPTPLLALATERASAVERAVLERVGAPDLTEAEVVDIQEVLVSTGALAALELEIEALTDEAIGALAEAPITDESRSALTELAHYVAWRER